MYKHISSCFQPRHGYNFSSYRSLGKIVLLLRASVAPLAPGAAAVGADWPETRFFDAKFNACCTNLLFSPYHTDISPKKYVCVFNFTNFERIDRFWKIYVRYASNTMRVFWSFFFQMKRYYLPHLHPGACSSPSQQRYLKVQPGIPARRWQQVWMVWQPKSGIIFCYQIHPKMKEFGSKVFKGSI